MLFKRLNSSTSWNRKHSEEFLAPPKRRKMPCPCIKRWRNKRSLRDRSFKSFCGLYKRNRICIWPNSWSQHWSYEWFLLSTFERGLDKLAVNWVEIIWLTDPVSTFWTYWDFWFFESLWWSSLLNNEGMKNILTLTLKVRSVKRGLAI